MRRGNEDHQLHRAGSERGDRKDSAALRAVGGDLSPCAAAGPGDGDGLKQLEGGQNRGARIGFSETLRTA